MELKPGYKLTEVGAIPEDWEVVRLEEIAEIDSENLGAATPICYAFNYISLEDVNSGSLQSYSEQIFATAPSRARRKLRAGDILVSTVRPNLKSHLLFSTHGDNWICSTGFSVVRCKTESHSGYIFAHLFANDVSSQIDTLLTGSNYPAINGRDVRQLLIPLPSFPEQSAIASAIGDVDALLSSLGALITKKRDLKTAAMQQLLTGKTRLPGFSWEWEVKRLGDLGSTYGGLVGKNKADFGTGTAKYVPFINVIMNVKVDCTEFDAVNVALTENQNQVIKEDLLFNGSSETPEEVALCSFMEQDIKNLYLNSFCFGFRLKNTGMVDGLFLAYYIRSPIGRDLMKSLAQGSTRYNLSKSALLDSQLRLPDKNEQTAIAEVISDMDAEITALETRRSKIRALKQAMMQELLTGRTRLIKSAEKPNEKTVAQTEGRKANVHFLRSVLAAEIIDQLHGQPTFGHVKFEKMMFLAENLCGVDTGSTYYRKAAGPYDNRALRSIDSQLQKRQWFEARKQEGRYQYVPLAKRGGHKSYFDRYFSGIAAMLEKILITFKTAKTEQCEIVATLLAAWSDLLREKGTVSDGMIVHEVLHNWHEAKQRIPEDRWLSALGWMREKGFVPKGVTLP